MTKACLLLIGVALATLVPPSDDPLLAGLEWRMIGPTRGGRSLAVTGDPSQPRVAYLGATGGGIWKTENGGISWKNISDGYFNTGAVGAIAVAESRPAVVYVGMGEACFRGDASHGDGVYRSTDSGKTWQHVGLEATRHIARVRIDPRDPDRVYVAAFGDGFGPSPDRGIYRSKDGGRTWEKVLYRGDRAGAIDLIIDGSNPRVLYASFLELRRFPWGLRTGGSGSGIFKSSDGGDTWVELTRNPGLPKGVLGRIGLAHSPARPRRVWAIADTVKEERGVFRSDDGGLTWRGVSDKPELLQRPWYYHHIVADPKDADTVYVLNEEMWRSRDAGATWEQLPVTHTDVHDLWIDPRDPQHLVQGNDGGGTISFDGGRSWSSLLNQPTAQLYHVTTDNEFPYRVYGAQQDNASISLPSRSDGSAITQADWRAEVAGEAGYIAVHPHEPIVYGADHHWLYREDHRAKQRRDISPNPETYYGWGTREMKYRFQWTYPVVLSPHDPETLYATAQVVFRSRTRGERWEIISPDLTRADPKTLQPTPFYGQEAIGEYWGPSTRDNTGVEWYATIFAFAESPVSSGVLWAGSDDGYVHVSQDGGKTWTNVTPPSLPEFALISIIDPSPHDAAVAYLAATRYKLQDRTPYLFKTGDYGRTWTRITNGLPEQDFTRVVREDPGRRGLLYAGTETGIYVSFDDGGRWRSLRLGRFPVVPVHDLMVKNGDLLAATHGRSFWVLDDVSQLQQLNEGIRQANVHLFKPRPTVRLRAGGRHPLRGMALGPDLAIGQNPPAGVVFRYFLQRKPAGEVVLAIHDASARLVRRFSSTSDRLPIEAGTNRFEWDMRYTGANVLPETVFWRRPTGPLAPPGRFTVTLSVDGTTQAQTFDIVKDPRAPYSDAELEEQFAFLIDIRDALDQAHAIVRRIRDLRLRATQAIERARGTPREIALTHAFRSLDGKLVPMEEQLTQYRARAQKDLLDFPSMSDDKLAFLAGLVSMSDGPPTPAARELLRELVSIIEKQREAVDAIARSEGSLFQ